MGHAASCPALGRDRWRRPQFTASPSAVSTPDHKSAFASRKACVRCAARGGRYQPSAALGGRAVLTDSPSRWSRTRGRLGGPGLRWRRAPAPVDPPVPCSRMPRLWTPPYAVVAAVAGLCDRSSLRWPHQRWPLPRGASRAEASRSPALHRRMNGDRPPAGRRVIPSARNSLSMVCAGCPVSSSMCRTPSPQATYSSSASSALTRTGTGNRSQIGPPAGRRPM